MGYKLNAAAAEVVRRILAAGGTMEMAADAVGCTRSALYAAAQREPEFKKLIKQSRAQSKTDSLVSLADGAKEDWRAAYKRLRMLYPEQYAREPHTMPASHAQKFSHEMFRLVKWAVGEDNIEVMKRIDFALNHTKQFLRAYKEAKQAGQKPDLTQLGSPEAVEGEPDAPQTPNS